MLQTVSTNLHCPTCHGALAIAARRVSCDWCARSWPVVDDVPHFGGHDYRGHILTLAQRETIAETAAECGWQVAMHTWLQAIDQQVYRQAVDEYRAHWRFLLPINRNSRVLDLNSDWGAAASNLAESCGMVVAAEACPARARFIAVRARQMKHDNLIALQLGFDQPLPFAPSSFDVVVLVDAVARLPQPEHQRQLLRAVHAILRPGGTLLLADSNRLSPAAKTDAPASGRRHTIWGYQQLLRSAQFHSLHTYALLPSHLEPFFMAPLDHEAPFASFIETVIRGQDVASHIRQRGRHTLYRLVRLIGAGAPLGALTRLARPFAPGIALVAQA